MQEALTLSLIDDDIIYQYGFQKILNDSDYQGDILIFSEGLEAINYIKDNLNHNKKLPDIIFLDINMPIMDGFQFMEEFTTLDPLMKKDIIIYMVTSSNDPSDVKRAKEISKISDYILKPIDIDTLLSLINH